MRTIFFFPILFLVCSVSGYKSSVLDDCDEDDITSIPYSRSLSDQPRQHTIKNDITSNMQLHKDAFHQSQKLQQQEFPQKKQFILPPQKQLQLEKRREFLSKRLSSRRQQRPMNLVIKPIVQAKSLEPAIKRKLYSTYPFKKQKRIKLIPAYDEFETYPDTDYVHEILYPPEPRAYVEMENPPGYSVPCDSDSDYKDLSTEIHENADINAREMNIDKDEEITSTESGVQTESEMETTTSALETTPNIAPRDDSIPIDPPEPLPHLLEIFMQALLALISCVKSKAPMLNDIISNILSTAMKSCASSSS